MTIQKDLDALLQLTADAHSEAGKNRLGSTAAQRPDNYSIFNTRTVLTASHGCGKANTMLGYRCRNSPTKPLQCEVPLLLCRGPVQNITLAKLLCLSEAPPLEQDGD